MLPKLSEEGGSNYTAIRLGQNCWSNAKPVSGGAVRWFASLAVVALTILCSPSLSRAQDSPLPSYLLEDERNTINVFQRASDSVVFITNSLRQQNLFSRNVMEVPRGSGSGFVWDRRGYIVTNAHVIQGGNSFLVTLHDGSVHDATRIGVDEFKDIAVLKIDTGNANLVPVNLGESENLLVGQKVIAIGNPFGLDRTLTTGVISALGREIQSVAGTTISDVIQTDASINPGNSGGPLLDSAGRLIGVNTSIFSTSGSSAGIGFAVPVSTVKRVVPQLVEKGRVSRAGLGVQVIEDDLARRWGIKGVIIREVVNGSAADRAGLKGSVVERRRLQLGDIIIGIDDKTIAKYDDLYTSLDTRNAGERVKVRFLRGEDEREVWVELQAIE